MLGPRPKVAKHLIKTWDFIERMERAHDAVGVERCLLDLAGLFGYTSVFGGVVPTPETPRSEITSRILLQRMPSEWTKRYNCPSADNLRLLRRFAKRGSGSSGLEFKRPAADAASVGLRWLLA